MNFTNNMALGTIAELADFLVATLNLEIPLQNKFCDCDFSVLSGQDETAPLDEIADAAEGWYGMKCVDAGFDSNHLLLVSDYYGGGCVSTVSIYDGESEQEATEGIRQAITETLCCCETVTPNSRLIIKLVSRATEEKGPNEEDVFSSCVLVDDECPHCGEKFSVHMYGTFDGLMVTCPKCQKKMKMCSLCMSSSGAECDDCCVVDNPHDIVSQDVEEIPFHWESRDAVGISHISFGRTSLDVRATDVGGYTFLAPIKGTQRNDEGLVELKGDALKAYCYLLQNYLCLINGGDAALEAAFEELEDVPVSEDFISLDAPFLHFKKGTTIDVVHRWFNRHHTKGLPYLLYGPSAL